MRVIPAILCEDLVRIYNTEGIEVQALQGLNLRVEHGEIVAIVGASGSGKSTLLSILAGLDSPTGGRAVVAGHDLSTMKRGERLRFQRSTVGFVWQQTSQNLLPYLTALENVETPMALAGTQGPGGKPRREHARELLDALGIVDMADRKPMELSGGQQQRVATAVALSNSPHVLLADEPTGALDRATSAELLELMRATSEALGVTMLVVTHDPTVSEHVRRTVQIRDGRTSTETLRRTESNGDTDVHVAEEFTVIDRAGRLQLPEHFVADLRLKDRVRLILEATHAEVYPENGTVPRKAPPGGGSPGGGSEEDLPVTPGGGSEEDLPVIPRGERSSESRDPSGGTVVDPATARRVTGDVAAHGGTGDVAGVTGDTSPDRAAGDRTLTRRELRQLRDAKEDSHE